MRKFIFLLLLLGVSSFTIFAQNTKFKAMYLGQKWPNSSEASCSGSGSDIIVDKSTLVYDNNPLIIYKDEELGLKKGDDHYMTEKLQNCLYMLSIAVRDYLGPNVKLRVTEAYDTNREHAENSLHYEGRAADITLSSLDRLAELGGLAQLCGFQWVWYENDKHIHVSVIKDSQDNGTLNGIY